MTLLQLLMSAYGTSRFQDYTSLNKELFGLFWTLSMVLYVEDKKIPQRFGDWMCLRPQVDGAGQTYSVGPVRKS
jgi:hypothetical protein